MHITSIRSAQESLILLFILQGKKIPYRIDFLNENYEVCLACHFQKFGAN